MLGPDSEIPAAGAGAGNRGGHGTQLGGQPHRLVFACSAASPISEARETVIPASITAWPINTTPMPVCGGGAASREPDAQCARIRSAKMATTAPMPNRMTSGSRFSRPRSRHRGAEWPWRGRRAANAQRERRPARRHSPPPGVGWHGRGLRRPRVLRHCSAARAPARPPTRVRRGPLPPRSRRFWCDSQASAAGSGATRAFPMSSIRRESTRPADQRRAAACNTRPGIVTRAELQLMPTFSTGRG